MQPMASQFARFRQAFCETPFDILSPFLSATGDSARSSPFARHNTCSNPSTAAQRLTRAYSPEAEMLNSFLSALNFKVCCGQ